MTKNNDLMRLVKGRGVKRKMESLILEIFESLTTILIVFIHFVTYFIPCTFGVFLKLTFLEVKRKSSPKTPRSVIAKKILLYSTIPAIIFSLVDIFTASKITAVGRETMIILAIFCGLIAEELTACAMKLATWYKLFKVTISLIKKHVKEITENKELQMLTKELLNVASSDSAEEVMQEFSQDDTDIHLSQ